MAEAEIPPPSSPKWKRPNEVMKLHLAKRRKALQDRMNCSKPLSASQPLPSTEQRKPSVDFSFKRNCFRVGVGTKRSSDGSLIESCSDNSLFHLLNEGVSPVQQALDTPVSFSNIFKNKTDTKVESPKHRGKDFIPVDWTLGTKVRFISSKPLGFSPTLKTCEEASGITGFVRCLDTGQTSSSLDTSPSARLHQCCLVWQHPSISWLEVFPRQAAKVSSMEGAINIAAHTTIRDSLQRDWAHSFQSLFQLVRARQCPYFYVCANTFTCLFRAAGIGGMADINALVTPTTRGFRNLLKDEDVEYTMPLKKKRKSTDGSPSESGYETNDSENNEAKSSAEAVESAEGADDADPADDEADDEADDGSSDRWLKSMGIEAAELRKLHAVQVQHDISSEKQLDKTPESLIQVEGVETQALYNFLLNCKSCLATTGPLAGVPPTLLAPVAFHGATLKTLKVRSSKVQVDSSHFHSLEVRGPILPHTVQELCDLMKNSVDEFSLTLAVVDSTKAFSEAIQKSESSVKDSSVIFGQESLSDCGLRKSTLETLCNADTSRVQLVDTLKYSKGVFSWL